MTGFLSGTQLGVPLLQVVLLMTLSTLALVFGRLRLALLINYCFTIYWGYILNIDLFFVGGGLRISGFTFLYLGFGLVILLLAMLGFFTHRDS